MAIEKQKELIAEINEMNNSMLLKKEAVMKYQGIIEYLNGNGVKLPETEAETETEVFEKN